MSDNVKDTNTLTDISTSASDSHVEAVRTQVEVAWAKLPFRAEPTWADIHAAISAVVRYFVGPRASVEPVHGDALIVGADPMTEPHTAEIIPLVVPVDPEKQVQTGETIDTSGVTPPTDQPPFAA